MFKCVVCGSEARDKTTPKGKPICDICGQGFIHDDVIDAQRFSEKRKDLAAALRWRFYSGYSTDVNGIGHDAWLISEYQKFEKDTEQRDELAVKALVTAEPREAEYDPDFLNAVSKAIGRSPEESQKYIAGLVSRKKVRVEWDAERSVPAVTS